jgi:hypothetical protein
MNSLVPRLFIFHNKYVLTSMTVGGLLGYVIGTGMEVNDEYNLQKIINNNDIITSGILGGVIGCSIGVVGGFL